MAKEKIIASTNQSNKPKLLETVKIPSNLRRSSLRMAHHLEFSNSDNNSIEVEEMGNQYESSEQGLTFEEAALSEEGTGRNKNSKDSKETDTALDSEMEKDSLDERSQPLEKANMNILLSLLLLFFRFVLLIFSFFCTFYLTLSISPSFTMVNLSSRSRDGHLLGLVCFGLDNSRRLLLSNIWCVLPVTQMWLLLILL